MPAGAESEGTRSVLYCVVPQELGEKLLEPLREHFRDDPQVEVVAERRREERRSGHGRRSRKGSSRRERRRVRSASGRRIADRRAFAASVGAVPPLPRKARRYAQQLTFIERLEPAPEHARDAASKRLVVRFQAGDEPVFGDLYLRYFNAVFSYARVALADHHEAEDVTQQVFMRALSALGRYEVRATAPFRSWLFSIARNAIVDALKDRHGLRIESPDQLETLREQEHADPDTVAETLGWLSDREVAMFVERLPLAQRQVLVLRFMLDLPADEISHIVGRSPSAVRQLQSRALQVLQRRLAAVGRTSSRSGPEPALVRMKPMPVMVRRRFALGHRTRAAA